MLYLILCLVFVFCFLFLDGPNDSLIYVDLRDDSTDTKIVGLFAVTLVIGVISVFIGALTACFRQYYSDSDSTKGRSRKKVKHSRIETVEVEVADSTLYL